MDKQIIISIGREFGSAGHEIAQKVASDLNIALYDRRILDDLAVKYGMDPKELEYFDETPKSRILSRKVKGYSSSISEAVAKLQFDYLRDKAKSGESFVVVGRCAEIALKDYEGLSSFFISGDMDSKIERVMNIYNLSKHDAISKIYRHDKKRRAYHDAYAPHTWGESKGYDICINSSKIGIDATAKLIETFALKKRF